MTKMRAYIFLHILMIAWCLALFFPAEIRADEEDYKPIAIQKADTLLKLYQYAAKTEPELICAGFGSVDLYESMEKKYARSPYGREYADFKNPSFLAEELFKVHHLPELHDFLLKGLLDKKISPGTRAERFEWQYETLTKALFFLYSEGDWPDDKISFDAFTASDSKNPLPKDKQQTVSLKNSLILPHLPVFTAMVDEDATEEQIVAWEKKPTSPIYEPWSKSYSGSLEELPEAMGKALLALWKGKNDELSIKKALDFLRERRATPELRCTALPFIMGIPAFSTQGALSMARIGPDLTVNVSGWHRNYNRFYYGTSIGACAKGANEALVTALSDVPHYILDAESKGPGITLTIHKDLPDMEKIAKKAPLYLLQACGPEDAKKPRDEKIVPFWNKIEAMPRPVSGISVLDRFFVPISAGPYLLPVTHGKQEDASFISRFWEIDGPRMAAVLISSKSDPARLSERIATLYLQEWNEEGEKSVLFGKPHQGSYLRWMLSLAKGKTASLMLEPGERMWFAAPSEEGMVWIEAAPEPGAQTLETPFIPGVLEVSENLMSSMNKAYGDDIAFFFASESLRVFPREKKTLSDALSFLKKEYKALHEGAPEKWNRTFVEMANSLACLWAAEGTEKEEAIRKLVFDYSLGPWTIEEKALSILEGKKGESE